MERKEAKRRTEKRRGEKMEKREREITRKRSREKGKDDERMCDRKVKGGKGGEGTDIFFFTKLRSIHKEAQVCRVSRGPIKIGH